MYIYFTLCFLAFICQDNPSRRCKHCACSVCGGKNDPDKQILCDECDMAFHLWCLTPPLEIVPESDDWWVIIGGTGRGIVIVVIDLCSLEGIYFEGGIVIFLIQYSEFCFKGQYCSAYTRPQLSGE